MSRFYCIKVINKDGTKGYVADMPEGIKIVTGGVHASIAQFKTEKDAYWFIRNKNIEKGGVKAYIRTNDDLIKDEEGSAGMSTASGDIYWLENLLGKKCLFDTKKDGYYFDAVEFGYCCWYTEKQIKDFIEGMDFHEPVIIKRMDNKGENITTIAIDPNNKSN